jgi:Rod binding domain-containing protein
MALDISASAQAVQAGSQNAQADQLLSKTRTSLAAPTSAAKQDAKIEKAGKDFESVLLGSWLQQAEQTFAKVPGGDGAEDDDDSSKDQFQGIAMQALAGSLTASGGIGIAKMITKNLHTEAEKTSSTGPTDAKTPVNPSL